MNNELNIGVIGAGGFAVFAANAFSQVPGVRIVNVFDVNKVVAASLAGRFGAAVSEDMRGLYEDDNVDLVYIATPPFLHYEQSKAALCAGKHVICEKPAALRSREAEELQALSKSKDRLYAVNLMQRYNPLYSLVKDIIDYRLLGDFLHGFFENYASDENLDEGHWFWDRGKSGGIFIEHGVHFFDLFSGWLGEGKVLSAFQLEKPGVGRKGPGVEDVVIDRVQATVLFRGAAVNFYHGFDQPKILDRQEMRLQFEKGDITLYEWVPVKMRLYGLLAEDGIARLKKQPGYLQMIGGEVAEFEFGNGEQKLDRYVELLKTMLTDQWEWIADRRHVRVIDDQNAVDSLRMAEEATRMAGSTKVSGEFDESGGGGDGMGKVVSLVREKRKRHDLRIVPYLLVSPYVLFVAVFVVFPVLFCLFLTFHDWNIISPMRFTGFGNYTRLFHDRLFWQAIGNTLRFLVVHIPLQLVVAMSLAYLLNRGLAAVSFFRASFFMPVIVSGVVVTILWQQFFSYDSGLFNLIVRAFGLPKVGWLVNPKVAIYSIAIMATWKNVGLYVILFQIGLQTVPRQYYEAAEMEGATKWQQFYHITLPMVNPTIFMVVILSTIGGFSLFIEPYVMTGGGPLNSTLSAVLYIYKQAFEYYNMGYSATLGLVYALIIVAVVMIQKRVIEKPV